MVINALKTTPTPWKCQHNTEKIYHGCSSDSDYILHTSITDFTPLHVILQTQVLFELWRTTLYNFSFIFETELRHSKNTLHVEFLLLQPLAEQAPIFWTYTVGFWSAPLCIFCVCLSLQGTKIPDLLTWTALSVLLCTYSLPNFPLTLSWACRGWIISLPSLCDWLPATAR